MNKSKLATILIALGLAAGLNGCAMFNKASMQYTRTTTLGQELLDLQSAKEKGVISEEEYNKAKATLLESISKTDVHISCKTDD